MKTVAVKDRHYGALEAAAARNGRSIQDLLDEAIESWLAEAAAEGAEHGEAEREETVRALAQPGEKGGTAFEAAVGGTESDAADEVDPVARLCGLLNDTDMPFLKDGDVDGYIADIRGR